jgi:MYXO-CTERM domain-containing protein
MQLTTWKHCVQVVVLALSLTVLPLTTMTVAQQRDTTIPTDTRGVNTPDRDDFPWGLLGLAGLLGLFGLKRRSAVVEHRRADEPLRRAV